MRRVFIHAVMLKLIEYFEDVRHYGTLVSTKRLRNCSAFVHQFNGIAGNTYYMLLTHNGYVAAITPKGTCYEWSLFVPDYTTTFDQHIAKFFEDYAPQAEKVFCYGWRASEIHA